MARGSDKTYEEFLKVTEPYWDPAFGLVLRIVRDRHAAEDILQESLMRAMQSFERLRNRESVKSWLLKIAHNTAINWLRRNSRATPVDFMDDLKLQAPETGPEERVGASSEREWVESLMLRLPPIYRSIILLRFKEGLSYKELAETLGIPMSSVKFRLHQAVKLMKEKVKGKF